MMTAAQTERTMQRALSRATDPYRASLITEALSAGPGTAAWRRAEADLARGTATALETLRLVADVVTDRLQPPGRAASIAAMLDELAEIGGNMPLTVADLASGLDLLGHARTGDTSEVTARRHVCSEISVQIKAGTAGDMTKLAEVFSLVADRLADSDVPSRRSAAETAFREATELCDGRLAAAVGKLGAEQEPPTGWQIEVWHRIAVEWAEYYVREELSGAADAAGIHASNEFVDRIAKRVATKLAAQLQLHRETP